MSGRTSGRFLTSIYPEELSVRLHGTEAVSACPIGQDLIRELGPAISRVSSLVLRRSDSSSAHKMGASRGAWVVAQEFIDTVWQGSCVKDALKKLSMRDAQGFGRADFDEGCMRDYMIVFLNYLYTESMKVGDTKVRVQLAVRSALDLDGG